ncbi:MAG: HAD hydrolase-like protein [Candidatus Aenigmatarchaeota archaeon]
MLPQKKAVVLDFDGTLTDIWAIEEPFEQAYMSELAAALSGRIERRNFDAAWERAKHTVLANPDDYGWRYKGKISVPAGADPCTFCASVADVVLDAAGIRKIEEKVPLLTGSFWKSYERVAAPFRPDAAKFVADIASLAPLYVVTNSATDSVKAKLSSIGAAEKVTDVVGSARKYAIDDGWERVPEHQPVDGSRRRIYLRRKSYFDVLSAIAEREGVKFSDMLAVGDVYDLDLALPRAVGADVCLVASDKTPKYAIDAVKKSGGYIAKSLSDVRHVVECLASKL